MADASLIARLLDVIEREIVPATRAGVAKGNKVFGAAILKKSDRSLVIADTNNEIENPLWHGEVHTLKRFYEMPSDGRPSASECLFLATHEPCSLCLSAITWAGFDNFHYLFSYAQSRDAFATPEDLSILREVFGLESGGYNASNAYWTAHSMAAAIDACADPERTALRGRAAELARTYADLSAASRTGSHATDR